MARRKPLALDEADLQRRAFAAYFRAASGEDIDQPGAGNSGVEEHEGKFYVVLRSVRGILAVYRVRAHDGVLKRLKRWPKEVE